MHMCTGVLCIIVVPLDLVLPWLRAALKICAAPAVRAFTPAARSVDALSSRSWRKSLLSFESQP